MGFFELLLIAIVGLVVIGPERLPETVRSIALWVGRLKRGVRETRDQLEQQIGADDIRRQLHNEEVMQRLADAEKKLNDSMSLEAPKSTLDHEPVKAETIQQEAELQALDQVEEISTYESEDSADNLGKQANKE